MDHDGIMTAAADGWWEAFLVDLALVVGAHLKDLVQTGPLLELLFLLLDSLLLRLNGQN